MSNSKTYINYLQHTIDFINQQTTAEAQFVRFIPCATIRTLSGNVYTVIYSTKHEKFNVSKRVEVGYLSLQELVEFLNEN